jgi:alpha-tubulin suppressor-like RCC1 family protein
VNLGQNAIVRAIAAGAHHTCAVTDAGDVTCWGGNAAGELGQGDTNDRSSPPSAPVALAERASAVATGASFSCALLANGTASCWGSNDAGELGTGDASSRLEPGTPVALDEGATAITAGDAHACALLEDGRVACWGSNAHGQLGTGDFENRAEPTLVDLGEATALAVSARKDQTCALVGTGDVKCWGAGARGQLGSGDVMDLSSPAASAVDLGTGRTATSIAAGAAFVCATLDLGQAKCWGNNTSSELGISLLGQAYGDEPGETGDFLPTVFQGGGRSVASVAAGRAHACALLDTGGVRCWGDNAFGQLGAGDRASHSAFSSPTAIVDLGWAG